MSQVEFPKKISKTDASPNDKPKLNEGSDEAIQNEVSQKNGPQSNRTSPNANNGPLKRTRYRTGNKSIMQRAIARKERSLQVIDKPRPRHNLKTRNLTVGDSSFETLDSHDSTNRKAIRTSSRVTKKRSCVSSESSDESLAKSLDNIRKSSRSTKISETKDEETTNVGEFEAQLRLRLCKCTEDKQLYKKDHSDSHFCSAIDGISEKLIGCTRLVNIKAVPMFRPSTRIPFGVFCESHRKRLINHNCCPACGIFCTEGIFVECQWKHHFHKDCILKIGDKECCPHCGDSTFSTDIVIKMHTSKKPVFLPIQRSHPSTARISFKDSKEDLNECKQDNSPMIPLGLMESLKSTVNVRLDECNELGLARAIENDDFRKVAAILEIANINMKYQLEDYNNGSFLHLAALKGSIQIAYILIVNRIDVDVLDSDQHTALMLAIVEHKNKLVEYLVKIGADIKFKGIDGMASLHIAAKCGNLDACKIILNSSSDISDFVNIRDDGGWTPLVWACEHGYCNVAKYLVSRGADINTRDVEHNIALHWAAFKGSNDIVEFLLNLKSDVNALNVHGDTPLHISAREDHYNTVIILLSRDADISLINKNNETPLDCVPKDGLCYTPLALNAQLQLATSASPHRNRSILVNDISRGREVNPIQCCNNIDNETEPKDYVYIRKNCLTSDNVQINLKVTSVQSCSCIDRCKSLECNCAKLSLKCWYDDEGKLSSGFNFYDPPLIFECNDLCACNSILCANRLVQKPLLNRFQLFKTPSKGWGVKSLNFIGTGSYVCEYLGEILTDSEAEHREDDSYLFDLDNRETDSFCIDAKFYGNFSRFINHSCNPNLHPIKVFIEHHDVKFPRIALFAKRDIESNEELTFDYGEKFWLVKYKSFTCDCGAECCKYSKEAIESTLEKYQMSIIE